MGTAFKIVFRDVLESVRGLDIFNVYAAARVAACFGLADYTDEASLENE